MALITLVYAFLVVGSRIGGMLFSYMNYGKNPLIPPYLFHYANFTSYFIIPFFCAVIVIIYRNLGHKVLNVKLVLSCFMVSCIHFLFSGHIEMFIQKFNPYAN